MQSWAHSPYKRGKFGARHSDSDWRPAGDDGSGRQWPGWRGEGQPVQQGDWPEQSSWAQHGWEDWDNDKREEDWNRDADDASRYGTWPQMDAQLPMPHSWDGSQEYPPLPRTQEDTWAAGSSSWAQANEEFRAETRRTTEARPEAVWEVPRERRKKYKVGGIPLNEEELKDLWSRYVRILPFDSYGACNFCSDGNQNQLYEVKESGFRKTYTLNVPAACACTDQEPDKSSWSSYEVLRHLQDVLDKLFEQKKIGISESNCLIFQSPVPARSFRPEPEIFPMDGHGGVQVRSHLQDTRRNRLQSRKVTLFSIEIDHDSPCSWGLVVACRPEHAQHSYQLTMRDREFRLEVQGAPWSPEDLEIVEKFHQHIVGEEAAEPEVMLVKVKNVTKSDGATTYIINLEAMKDLGADEHNESVELREPFRDLIRKMDRLMWWEVARCWAPVEPAANPLVLHKIFDQPQDYEQEEFENDLDCLVVSGKYSLRLAAAVAESAIERDKLDPDLSSDSLDKKVQEYLNPELAASLMAFSGLISYGTLKRVGPERAADMLFALIGAHKNESDMFAVVQLWDWLIQDPVDGRQRPEGVKSLKRANQYTAGCPRYLGRTNSYLEFGEALPPEEEKEFSKYLKVKYAPPPGAEQLEGDDPTEEHNEAVYRWNDSQAEEKRPTTPTANEWKPLIWNPLLGTFCSPSMKLSNGDPRPLPNKVCAWLRGRGMKKLVKIKHSMESTPPYLYLREEKTEKSEKDIELSLFVTYKELQGEVEYRRQTCGLGQEIYQDKRHLLSYSESKKTLVSQVEAIVGQALPRKVVTWLLESRNLGDLIPGRKRAATEVETKEDKAYFTSPSGETIELQAERIPGHCGSLFKVIIVEGEAMPDGEVMPKALSYSEERKEWVFFQFTKSEEEVVVVPWEAIAWVGEKTSQEAASRLTTPTAVRRFFPKASGTAVARIEQQADHRFNDIKLLAEALTHSSAITSAVQPFDHLAYVGAAAMESFSLEQVMKEATFFNSQLVIKEGDVGAKTFCAPKCWNSSQGLSWNYVRNSKLEEKDPGLFSLAAMYTRFWASCNHVGYAVSCLKHDLHKNLNFKSQHLQDHIDRLLKKYPKSEKSEKEPVKWQTLFKLGAPKALGDEFLAVIGAITMDSDYNEARTLMTRHYTETSKDIFTSLGASSAQKLKYRILGDEPMAPETIVKALAHHLTKAQELALAPPLLLTEEDQDQGLMDFVKGRRCKDLNFVYVADDGTIACSSPRAMLLNIKFQQNPEEGSSSEDADRVSSEATNDEDLDDAKKNAEKGAIYCKHCQMWLNGPTQWADHEIGKKHRKAVHRQQGTQVFKDKEPEDSSKETEEVPKPVEEKKSPEPEAIYCKYCNMWLNGPTQWEDHEKGRKHRKAMQKENSGFQDEDGIELDEEDVEMNQGSVLQQEMYDYQSFAQDQGMQQFQFQ